MKASIFPREYIGFEIETQKFLSADELVARGVTLTGDGLPYFQHKPFEFVVLWYSGQRDSENQKLYEGDLVEMDIKNEFGSFVKDKAIMQWNAPTSQFILKMGSLVPNQILQVMNVKKIGHEFTNPDIAVEITTRSKQKNNG